MISPLPNVFHSVHDDRSGEDLSALSPAKAAVSIPVDKMKLVLRWADCLYDKAEIWMQLGATGVPEIPDILIQEAFQKSGRIILKCSSISEKTKKLEEIGCTVAFFGSARPSHYTAAVSEPKWIVVPSHVDESTLGKPRSAVVTEERIDPEDSFAARAYARFDGNRQPSGCEELAEFTTEATTVVGSRNNQIFVFQHDHYGRKGHSYIGELRFGAPRKIPLS